MKVKVDLSEDLVQQLRSFAAREKVDVNDLVIQACRAYLDSTSGAERAGKPPRKRKFPSG